ncbi:MAG TPA: glycine cleavage T C-terminal barrel domain-containing protein [Pyrinomonadaceae bacterium]
MDIEVYNHIRSGGAGFYEQKRGLIAVWGKEAVQFLDGMITNDMKTLGDGEQMLAAFPNAQGRLLAVVRLLRQGDRFLIETEEATREKVFQNLFRFTFAGDFFVEDLSDQYQYLEIFGGSENSPPYEGGVAAFRGRGGSLGLFIEGDGIPEGLSIDDATYETLRIESGIPLYGVDMDETTIVPELGVDGLISYTKGCYIGQEIIARIHFRGHVAKRLTGLVLNSPPYEGGVAEGRGGSLATGSELTAPGGKPAGRITSLTYSPKLERTIALAYVRYDYLQEGTELAVAETSAIVKELPFVE